MEDDFEFNFSTGDETEFNLLDYEQDAVLEDYTRALKGNKKLAGNLHMFFSCYRIPVGLTDKEVWFCAVHLYPLKRRLLELQQESIRKSFGNEYTDSIVRVFQEAHVYRTEVRMPEEFRPDKLMTRERFQAGVEKFFKQTSVLYT